MIDVLPRALATAAAAVRACARLLDTGALDRSAVLEDVRLAAAVDQLTSTWTVGLDRLGADVRAAAQRLDDAAQEYAALESLLVPR